MSKKKTIHKLLAIMLSITMVVGMMPVSASTGTDELPIGASSVIIAIEGLAEEIVSKSVPLGTSEADLDLPETLTATVLPVAADADASLDFAVPSLDDGEVGEETEFGADTTMDIDAAAKTGTSPSAVKELKDDSAEEPAEIMVPLPVTWVSSPGYDSETAGEYFFTPILPEGFTLAIDVELPAITVTVNDIAVIKDEITIFTDLAEDVACQSVPTGTEAAELTLPDQLTVIVNKEETNIEVRWQPVPVYDGKTPGEYIFTPVLPERYTLADGVELPRITVTVGLDMLLAMTGIDADYSWYDADKAALEFEISTPAQLKGLADIVNGNHGTPVDLKGKKVYLISDLDLSGYDNWTPIGTETNPFAGAFEGNSHTISNLIVNMPDTDHVGLFGMVKGAVSNLILTDVNITGKENVGGIAGEVWGELSRCAVVGGVIVGYGRIGGVAGKVAYDPKSGYLGPDYLTWIYVESSLTSCFATCDVFAAGHSPFSAGGVAGSVNYGNLNNCYSTGNVGSTGFTGTFSSVGGIVGAAANASIIKCYAIGEVSGTMYIGGVVGSLSGSYSRPSELRYCAGLNLCISGDSSWYEGPKTGRVAGRLTPQYGEWDTLLAADNFSFAGMSVDGGGGDLDGTGKSSDQIRTEDIFAPYGFSAPVWEGGINLLPILAGFPEGLQSPELPVHLISAAPSKPSNFSARYGIQWVTISWGAPGSIGDSALIRYEVRKNNEGWISVGMSTFHTFIGLDNGTTYTFYVRAVNSNGNGAEAAIEETPGQRPGQPTNIAVTPWGNTITLTWNAPDEGTGEIWFYEVRYSPYHDLLDSPWILVSDANYYEFINKGDINKYTVEVRATNAYGTGPPVRFYGSISQNPSPPRNFTATRGDGRISLSWSSPEHAGSSAIIRYEVFNPVTEAWLNVGTANAYTITGLTNGQPNRFQVRAVNSSYGAGSSAALVIDSREPPVIYTEDNFNLAYGTTHLMQVQAFGTEPFTYSLIGAPIGVTIEDPGSLYIDGTTPAGTYHFTIKVSNGSAPDAMQSFTLTVTPYTPKLSDLQFTPIEDRTYDGTGTGIGPVSDRRGLGLDLTVYYEGTEGTNYPQSTTPPKNPGSYKVIASIAGNISINATSFPLAFYSILPKAVTVTPVSGQNKAYGQPDPVLQYTLSPALAAGESLTGVLFRAPGENVGSYEISIGTLSGGSNYMLSLSDRVGFQIYPKSNAVFSISEISPQTYTGTAFVPEPEVRDGSVVLKKGIDFTYSYEDNINAGASAAVHINGMGNYAGSTGSRTFAIHKAESTLGISCADITYGETPAPIVDTNVGGGTVTYEYKVQGADDSTYTTIVPTVAGNYTARGISAATINYNAATATANFRISKATPSLMLTADPAGSQTRPGSVELLAVLPDDATGTLTFKAGADTIAAVTLPGNTTAFTPKGAANAYSFTVDYSGDSNYESVTGTALEYSFTKSDQAALITEDGTVSFGNSLDLSSLVNGGSGAGSVSFSVIDGPGEIDGTMLTPIGAGIVCITVTKEADNDYNASSAAFKVSVSPRSIIFTVAPVETYTYTGSAITPKPEVRDGSVVLSEGVHFAYSYHNNIDVSTSAEVRITGIGSYEGSTGSSVFPIDRAVPDITVPPAVSGTVYTGTILSNIRLTGGSADVSGHYEWMDPSAVVVYGTNTFEACFVPDETTHYIQVEGIIITFNAVNRVRHDSSDDSKPIVPAAKLNQPTVANVTAVPWITNGRAALAISDNMVKAAINKAAADAIAKGTDANGIRVNVTVKAASATGFVITLKRAALSCLLDAGVKSFSVSGLPVSLSFDTEAVKEILKQSDGNVVLAIKPVTAVSLRNAYDIQLSSTKNGKAVNIHSLSSGTSTLGIYTVPGELEAAGCLYGAYEGSDKKINRIADSVYDANSKRVIFSTNHFSVYGAGYTAPSAKLTDISSHWAKESIDYVVSRGLLDIGRSAEFQPDTPITIRECITALGRLSGVNVSRYKFSSYLDYFMWVYKKGILYGVTNSLFALNRTITREEIAVILSNYIKATGGILPVTREAANFADASSIGSVYRTAVNSMQQAGILMGGSSNKFNPKVNATRAEFAEMLHRFIKLSIDASTTQGWSLNDDGQLLYYKNGAFVTGWQMIDGVKYFFCTDGSLDRSTRADSCEVDESGMRKR